MSRRIHLVCNAHLDPLWLWNWEEGAAEAMATFRIAADFCEEFDDFIFNHNEALLYKWIEQFEPKLFDRIQKLIKQGRWHVIGGWYVQPDCNMPCGESFVRQILIGRCFFRDAFGVEPTTALNFDSFGHSRGLVQILVKAGYDSYIHTRPNNELQPLPANTYIWVGFDGSEIRAYRDRSYNTGLGKAEQKILTWLNDNPNKDIGLILWGVGNHGGGPSRLDLSNLSKLISETNNATILHSTPEKFFNELDSVILPKVETDLYPSMLGCYTSQIRIKQKHRLLENEFYSTEKMASTAAMQDLLQYPAQELNEALNDLMLSQFHDILPGSSIQPVEETGLRILDHGLEIVSRVKAKSFFALAAGQEKAKEGEIPILVYNPHPFAINGIFECEFNLADVKLQGRFSYPIVYRGEERLPSQNEKEHHNVNIDWRRRAVFAAELKPSQMNRFDCRFEIYTEKPKPLLTEHNGTCHFKTRELEVVINAQTGLLDQYRINGLDYLKKNSFCPLVIKDVPDSWAVQQNEFREIEGAFKLMTPEEGTQFSGVTERVLPSVRVIEDGDVRTVIEAVFQYHHSFICQTYLLPKQGTEIEIQVRVYWNEKDRMLKWSIPTLLNDSTYHGQAVFGVANLPNDGRETVAQKWVMAASQSSGRAVTCINDGLYGSDFANGEIRLSLLRSAAYSCHYFPSIPLLIQDRFLPRIDQGERMYRFWINAGNVEERLTHVDREAVVHNEMPFALSMFPEGSGTKPLPGILLHDDAVQLVAFKQGEDSGNYIVRLFEPSGSPRSTTIEFPSLGIKQNVQLSPFEIKTYCLDIADKTLSETKLLE